MFVEHNLFAQAPALGYGPIAVLLGIAICVATAIIVITHVMPKPKRQGPEKDATFESGMEVIGDARRHFNVKFYLVAVMFLIFDVELIFLYPWAVAFLDAKGTGASMATTSTLFWVMLIFFGVLTLGFIYEWGKGVLRYD